MDGQITISLSNLVNVIAIILSIVALFITIIGFFASLKFYRDGVKLQGVANDAMTMIKEKTEAIQSQVGGMFDKTLDAALNRSNQMSESFEEINAQMEQTSSSIVDAALKEIGTASKKEKVLPVNCSICGKTIDSIAQTIGGPAKDEFSHFDCAIRTLSENETIQPGQKICYIGNGDFAVIEYNKKNFSGGFSVVKRISYENQEMKNSVKKLVSERKKTARI